MSFLSSHPFSTATDLFFHSIYLPCVLYQLRHLCPYYFYQSTSHILCHSETVAVASTDRCAHCGSHFPSLLSQSSTTLERSRIHCQTWRRFFYCRVSYCLDSCFLFWYTPFLPLLFLPFRLIRAHVPCATCSLTLFPVPAFRLFLLHYKLDLYLPDIFDYALRVFKLEVS